MRSERRSQVATVTMGLISLVLALVAAAPPTSATSATVNRPHIPWPVYGESAFVLGDGAVHASPYQAEVPIASLAKMMTAYLVLKKHPLSRDEKGFTLTVTQADVHDTALRRSEDQSLIPVVAGERLTERQALAALLLPSANNIAAMLAERTAGSLAKFVAQMNATARSLGMKHTIYTDPSGFKARTRSTATDQLTIALLDEQNPVFAAMVRQTSYRIPVAGTVHSTDTLLGTDGFIGIKTGSDSAAGGCFAFRSRRDVNNQVVALTGIVLGQRGENLIAAGLNAARNLTDRITPLPARDVVSKPVIKRLSAITGKLAGGQRIIIRGIGFTHVRTVKFGAVKGTSVKVESATKLLVTTPEHAAGTVDVLVTTAYGTSALVATDRYTYQPPVPPPSPSPSPSG